MHVLVLSAYDAASHRRWRRGLVSHLEDRCWTTLTLAPRFFGWRVRGNSLSWGFDDGARRTLRAPHDVLLATSMCDLSALRGFVPELARLPTIVYFHENQFAYPTRGPHRDDIHPRMLSIYTALCADRLLFNSPYNRETFLDGAADLLAKMPDAVPEGLVTRLERRASVVPVPLEDELFEPGARDRPADDVDRGVAPSIVWNHRWEHDKAPERFFAALEVLADRGRSFRVHVVGQQFRERPAIFDEARESLADRIESWGFIEDRARYLEILRRADLVISTALHDFQGLSVLEATVAGCVPVVPDRLAYPAWIPSDFRYDSHPDAPSRELTSLVQHLERRLDQIERGASPLPPALEDLRWSVLGEVYATHLDACSSTSAPTPDHSGA
jgi:glycosyltransferase involved in cell wall biosynthesis